MNSLKRIQPWVQVHCSLGATQSLPNTATATVPALLGGSGNQSNMTGSRGQSGSLKQTKKAVGSHTQRVWSRNKVVSEFEQRWAETMFQRCLSLSTAPMPLTPHWPVGNWLGRRSTGDPIYLYCLCFLYFIQRGHPCFCRCGPGTFQMDPTRSKKK